MTEEREAIVAYLRANGEDRLALEIEAGFHDAAAHAQAEPWPKEARYRSDEPGAHGEPTMEMRLSMGGNGDWYLSILPERERFTRHCVRITTSGTHFRGMPKAAADLFRAMITRT